MKHLAFVLMSLSLLAAGCGSKDKKTDSTTPDPAPAAEASATSDDSDSSTETAEPDAPKPSLKPVVYFQFDSFELDDEARTTLNRNADWMKADPSRTLTIEGHTDEVGTPGYNLALGEKRARAARDYIVRLGIDESRVKILTYGEERPAASDDALNRRSVFVATRK